MEICDALIGKTYEMPAGGRVLIESAEIHYGDFAAIVINDDIYISFMTAVRLTESNKK